MAETRFDAAYSLAIDGKPLSKLVGSVRIRNRQAVYRPLWVGEYEPIGAITTNVELLWDPRMNAEQLRKVFFPLLDPAKGNSERRAFLDLIASDPANEANRLVYSDWLEEHGETQEAERLRDGKMPRGVNPLGHPGVVDTWAIALHRLSQPSQLPEQIDCPQAFLDPDLNLWLCGDEQYRPLHRPRLYPVVFRLLPVEQNGQLKWFDLRVTPPNPSPLFLRLLVPGSPPRP